MSEVNSEEETSEEYNDLSEYDQRILNTSKEISVFRGRLN